VVLHGEDTPGQTYAMLEFHIVREAPDDAMPKLRPDLQSLLDQFASVLDAPTGLPPRRQYDHQIPLIPGARHVSMRPYRVAPEFHLLRLQFFLSGNKTQPGDWLSTTAT
jgi:hypothetical protein